jgi:hypothetical protein
MRRSLLLLMISLGLPLAASCTSYPYNRYDCGNSDFYIELQGGGYRLQAPGFAFGEILSATGVPLGDIPEFEIGNDHIHACYPRLTLGVEFYNGLTPCWVGTNLFFELNLAYLDTDRTSNLGNGSFTGFVLPTINGSGGFLGATTPTTFSGVNFKRKYRYSNVAFKMGSDFLSDNPQLSLRPFVEFDIDSLHQGYIINVGSITTGAVVTSDFRLDESLQTQYYDFGLGIDGSYAFSPCCNTFFVFGEGAAFVSHAETRLHGRENATSALGVVTTSTLHSKHETCLFKARGEVGVGYQFGYNLALSVTGLVEYWSYVPEIINPQLVRAGLPGVFDRPAHIDRTSATNYGLLVGLTFIFF